jgi:hypothetical protein
VDVFGEFAILQLFAVGAGFEAFSFHAIPYFTFGTMRKFHSFFAATGAINHFSSNVVAELGFPFFGGLRTQFIVIGYGGFSGITSSTIKATTGNQFFHEFDLFLKIIVEILSNQN